MSSDAPLYVPGSYQAMKARWDLELAEKAATGVGFGDSVVLGPAGSIAGFLREKSGSGRTADKALYKYLYTKHPFVYACVELIVQTAAQDRHTYPTEDAPGSGGKKSSPTKDQTYAQKARGYTRPAPQKPDDGSEGVLGPAEQDGEAFLEEFFAEVNDFESFNELLASVYRDVLVYGEAFVLKQRIGASVKTGHLPAVEGGSADRDTGTTPLGGRVTHVSQDPTSPVECLHRIPSRDTFAVPGEDGYPSMYRQKAEGGGYREYAETDVIYVRLPDPDDPCHGLSPLEALDITLATDISAGKYNEAYFRNGAKAGLIIAGENLNEHEIRRNKQWLTDEYTRPENAHKPMLLLGNLQLVRDGNKAQNDMEFLDLRKFSREEICAVYSVPMSKLLHTSDGMGSTGKATDDMTFRADTVGPLQTKVYEAFNRQLMKRDFPDKPLLVPPRQEKIRLDLLEAAKSLVACGGTGNEARAVLHLPESDHPTMNLPLFLVPGLKSLITDDVAEQSAQGDGEPLKSGSPSNALRPDRTSTRTSSGQKNARAKGGSGMAKVRKAEAETDDDQTLVAVDAAAE